MIELPSCPPGNARITSTTARPADKGTTTESDPALIRRTVTGLVDLAAAHGTPMRRSAARAVVDAYLHRNAGSLDGWARWLRNTNGILDPTGETAARRIDLRWSHA